MNELGREVLTAATLRGVRQIRGALWDSLGGRCAQGVLIEAAVEALNARRAWWQRRDAAQAGHWVGLTWVTRRGASLHLPSLYGMSDREFGELAARNNRGESFLDLAGPGVAAPERESHPVSV